MNAAVQQHNTLHAASPGIKTIPHLLNQPFFTLNGALLYKNSLIPGDKYRNIRYCFTNIIEVQKFSQIIILAYTQSTPSPKLRLYTDFM